MGIFRIPGNATCSDFRLQIVQTLALPHEKAANEPAARPPFPQRIRFDSGAPSSWSHAQPALHPPRRMLTTELCDVPERSIIASQVSTAHRPKKLF